jgi:hypothetical protein
VDSENRPTPEALSGEVDELLSSYFPLKTAATN